MTGIGMHSKRHREAKPSKPKFSYSAKAQSAMEYLMTYGWAILIIAVVLGALFQLGVFTTKSYLPAGCIPQSGFLCSNPVLSTSGVLTVTIGQAIAQQLSNVNVYFVPSGGTLSNAASASIGTLNMGQEANVQLQLPTGSPYPGSYALGTPLTGYVYLGFTESGISQTVEIGTLTTKVQSTSAVALAPPPTTVPSGIVAYVPITITNSQSTATPAPFQQMIQFSESSYSNYLTYNGNIANFEFFTQSGSIIPAWIESNNSGTITVWLNLANGVPASNSITVYLGFASQGTNLLSSSGTTGIGEAPQLSSTYAQYDDGASVFNNYWNFAGTTLPSNAVEDIPSSDVTINNGITLSTDSTGTSSRAGVLLNVNYGGTNIIAETYASSSASSSSDAPIIEFINSNSSTSYSGTYNFLSMLLPNQGTFYWQPTSGGSSDYTFTATSPNTYYVTGIYKTGASYTPYLTYSSLGSSESAYEDTASYVQLTASITSGVTTKAYWLRTRAYPPNGVMPSYSFGAVQ